VSIIKHIRNIISNNSFSTTYLAAYDIKNFTFNNFAHHWIGTSCYCGLFRRRNLFYIIERHATL